MEEAGTLIRVDFILNLVLDEEFEVLHAVAGDPLLAHRAGCRVLDQLYKVDLWDPAEVVVVVGGISQGLDLYQAQNALWNAAQPAQEGGMIVLLARCPEGWWHETFECRLLSGDTPQAIGKGAIWDFALGGHKAVRITETADRASIYLVSAMNAGTFQSAGLRHFDDLQPAVEAALHVTGSDADVLLMPHGGGTLPVAGSD